MRRGLPPALLGILLLQLVWGAAFIARTSFELDGHRHFVLFDDAMISMAYAKNAADGHGLVWSPEQEPVEGFTNPLWTGVMAVVHLLPLPPRLLSLPIQILSLGLLLLHTVLVHHLARRFFMPHHPRAALLPAALAAFYVPLAYWSLLGMEAALQAVLVTGAVWPALEIVEEDRDRWIALGTLLALGYLTRMDLLLPAAVILGWVVFTLSTRDDRRVPFRRAAPGLAVLAAAVLGYQAFRMLYFGDPLPNTYYLKLTGIPLAVRWLQGLATFGDFLTHHAVLLGVVLTGTAVLLKRRPALQLPALLFFAGCAYSVYVGGDAWEPTYFPDGGGIRANRFLAYLMPQAFLLAGAVLDAWLDWSSRGSREDSRRTLWVAVGVGLLVGSTWIADRGDLLFTRPPLMTPEHHGVLEDWRRLERLVPPDRETTVATFWAGIPAYFNPGYSLVDVAGYTDRDAARKPAFPGLGLDVAHFERARPGHVKFDYPHLLAEVRPDVVFQTYPMDRDFAARLLRSSGYTNESGFWVLPRHAPASAEAHGIEPHSGLSGADRHVPPGEEVRRHQVQHLDAAETDLPHRPLRASG